MIGCGATRSRRATRRSRATYAVRRTVAHSTLGQLSSVVVLAPLLEPALLEPAPPLPVELFLVASKGHALFFSSPDRYRRSAPCFSV